MGSRVSETPRVLRLRLSSQVGRWRSWCRRHEICSCESLILQVQRAQDMVSIWQLRGAKLPTVFMAQQWAGTCPSWGQGSVLLNMRLRKQSYRAWKLLKASSWNHWKCVGENNNNKKNTPQLTENISQSMLLSISILSTVQYTFCKCILTSLLILPCAHSILYLTFHSSPYSALGTIKQIAFLHCFLFICAHR